MFRYDFVGRSYGFLGLHFYSYFRFDFFLFPVSVLFRFLFPYGSFLFVIIPSRFRFRWFSDSVLIVPIKFFFSFGSLLFSVRSFCVPFLLRSVPPVFVSSRLVSVTSRLLSVSLRFVISILFSVPFSVGVNLVFLFGLRFFYFRFDFLAFPVGPVLFRFLFPFGFFLFISVSIPYQFVRDRFRIRFLVSIPPLFQLHSLAVPDSVLISVGVPLVCLFVCDSA